MTPALIRLSGRLRLPCQNTIGLPKASVPPSRKTAVLPNSVVKFVSLTCTQIVRDSTEDT
jgi:hypothetical protein